MQEFAVKYMDKPVGNVLLEKEGLYCHIRCVCMNMGSITRLLDVRDHETISIGICGPIRGGFGLDKKIPGKYMEATKHEFLLVTETEEETVFYPLDVPLPTDVLMNPDRLRFCVRDHKVGITIAPH